MKDDRDVEQTFELSDFIAELRRLADTLEANGAFEIEIDGETVQVSGDAIFSIEHEREDGREELEFQLSWGEAKDEDSEEDDDEASDEDEE
jgi:amphi-Trp domain-containing protein